MNNNAKNFSTISLVCGILGLVAPFIPVVGYFSLVFSIVAIVLGVKARKLTEGQKNGMATAGFVLGIIGTVLGGLMIVCTLCAVGTLGAAGALGSMQ